MSFSRDLFDDNFVENFRNEVRREKFGNADQNKQEQKSSFSAVRLTNNFTSFNLQIFNSLRWEKIFPLLEFKNGKIEYLLKKLMLKINNLHPYLIDATKLLVEQPNTTDHH